MPECTPKVRPGVFGRMNLNELVGRFQKGKIGTACTEYSA